MQLSHTLAAVSASFDDPNLVSAAGLVPIMRLADEAGLTALAQDRLSVPTDKGANAGAKITTLVGVLLQSWPESRDDPVFILLGSLRASVLRQPRTPD